MKNLVITWVLPCLLLIMVFGCSSENDNDLEPNSTLFIGTWKPIKEVEICTTGSEDAYLYSACEQEGRLIVNPNGTFYQTYFYEYIDNMCEEDGLSSGTWVIVNDKLFVTEEGFQKTEITFFEVNKNILRVGLYEIDPEYTCDGNNLPSHLFMEFIKVD